MPQGPLIGVGVPVWGGADFVAETLQSVLDQRGARWQLVISVDGADETTERACRPFTSDSRVRLIVQARRLGWVQNTAAVLAAAGEGAEFACVQPHDDWIEPDYLATLVDAAGLRPQAAVVFSDMIAFGTIEGAVSQDSVAGSPLQRQLALLRQHYNALAYRGLIRLSSIAGLPPISGNDHGDFACDTHWMARLARAGDLIRVPKPLYHKRYHAQATHAAWRSWPLQRKLAAWTGHCLDMLAEALTVAGNAEERRLLIAAGRDRLVLRHHALGPYAHDIHALSPAGLLAMQAAYEAAAAARPDIGPLRDESENRLLRAARRLLRRP